MHLSMHLLLHLLMFLPMLGTVTLYGVDGNPFDQNSIEAVGARFLRTYVRMALSGNYPTGGDLFDLTNGGGTPAAPTVVPQAQNGGLVSIDFRPFSKLTTSFAAVGGQYEIINAGGIVPIPFSAINALRLQLWLASNAQYANGAYGADALGDVITAELIWKR